MLFIDFTQRDTLSIIVDVGGLVGWITLGGYVVTRLIRKTKSERNESSALVKKKTEIRRGQNIFGPWSKMSEEYEGSVDHLKTLQEVQTEAEIKKETNNNG